MASSPIKKLSPDEKVRQINKILQEISQAINEVDILADLFIQIRKSLSKILDVTNFFIARYDARRNQVTFPYFIDTEVENDNTKIYPLEDMAGSLTELVISTGSAQFLTKEQILGYLEGKSYDAFGKISDVWMGVPMKIKGEITGVIAVQNYHDKHAYDEEDFQLLSTVSDQVAVAIELKAKEESLKKSESRFRHLVEQIQEIIYLTNSSGRIEYISPALEAITGYPPHLLSGSERYYRYSTDKSAADAKTFSDFIHQDDRKTIDKTTAEALKKTSSFQQEYRLITKEGKPIWVIEKGRFFKTKNGDTALEGIIINNQDQKRAELINQALYNISNAVNATSDLDELYESIHRSLDTVLNTENFYIALYDWEEDRITFPYSRDRFEAPQIEPIEKVSQSTSLTGVVIRSGKNLMLSREESFQLVKDLGGEHIGEPAEIWIGVPLKYRTQTIGAMVLQSYDNPTLYSRDDEDILVSVSEQVATAIEYKRAEEELKKRETVIRTLFNISNAINTTSNLEDLFHSIHSSLANMIDVRNFRIAIYDEERDLITFAHDVKDGEKQPISHIKEASKQSYLVYDVIKKGSYILRDEDEIKELIIKDKNVLPGIYYKTWLGIPLRSKEKILGVVILLSRDHRNCFTPTDVELLNAVSDQIGFAIERKKSEVELSETQKQLIESAHQAGMAKIAAETLHNVGNILNSVKVSADVISSINRESSFYRYQQANELMRANYDNLDEFLLNDPKGKQLLEYYLRLETAFESENRQLQEQVITLNEKIQLMTDIIFDQQAYAGSGAMLSEHTADEIIDSVLKMQSDMLSKHHIHVVKHFNPTYKLYIQKTKFIHVMINLIKNAKDSLLSVAEDQRKIVIDVNQEHDFVHIDITDNGDGISKEILPNLFSRGFTTKKEGHGFGLHNSLNYMKEMNGNLEAKSDGPTKGATFTLVVPSKR